MRHVTRPAVSPLRFLGAPETVTGSRFLVDTPPARVLVDWGLFQGLKALRLRNWEPFPVAPETIDPVLRTHAHLDHTGYLPALGHHGFQGHIFATKGTRDLCRIVLPDSGHLQEEDAAYANRKGFSKHAPALPLYTAEDARQVVERFTVVPFDLPVEVAPGRRATFRCAGHILGSATLTLDVHGAVTRTLVLAAILAAPRLRSCVPRRFFHGPIRWWWNRPTATAAMKTSPRSGVARRCHCTDCAAWRHGGASLLRGGLY